MQASRVSVGEVWRPPVIASVPLCCIVVSWLIILDVQYLGFLLQCAYSWGDHTKCQCHIRSWGVLHLLYVKVSCVFRGNAPTWPGDSMDLKGPLGAFFDCVRMLGFPIEVLVY